MKLHDSLLKRHDIMGGGEGNEAPLTTKTKQSKQKKQHE